MFGRYELWYVFSMHATLKHNFSDRNVNCYQAIDRIYHTSITCRAHNYRNVNVKSWRLHRFFFTLVAKRHVGIGQYVCQEFDFIHNSEKKTKQLSILKVS